MIVVDANIILYCFSDTPATAAAREVRRRDPDWIVPALWRFEILNALSVLRRSGAVTASQAAQIFSSADEVLQGREKQVDGVRILELAERLGITGYDAAYVALALQSGVDLVTEDRRLLRAAAPAARSMADFLSASGGSILRESGLPYTAPRRPRSRRTPATRA
jgi:predicted nucleic acid-binding protein